MADTKISALGAATILAAADLIPVVAVADTSMAASGTTKAITAAAFHSPARFAAYNNTSPADGDVYYGSVQKTLAAQFNGAMHRFVGCLFSQTADVTVANTTTETTLFGTGVGTPTLPANFLVAGKTIRLTMGGTTSFASGSYRVKVKLGSTVLFDSTALTAVVANNLIFRLDALLTCRLAGASGSVQPHVVAAFWNYNGPNKAAVSNAAVPAVTVDTTAGLAVDVTFAMGTAAAGNTITVSVATVEVLN